MTPPLGDILIPQFLVGGGVYCHRSAGSAHRPPQKKTIWYTSLLSAAITAVVAILMDAGIIGFF